MRLPFFSFILCAFFEISLAFFSFFVHIVFSLLCVSLCMFCLWLSGPRSLPVCLPVSPCVLLHSAAGYGCSPLLWWCGWPGRPCLSFCCYPTTLWCGHARDWGPVVRTYITPSSPPTHYCLLLYYCAEALRQGVGGVRLWGPLLYSEAAAAIAGATVVRSETTEGKTC